MAKQNQSERERLQIRQSIRRHEEDVRKESENLASLSSGALQQKLHEVNELQRQITKPREHALDAGLFCQLTEAGFKATEKLVKNQSGRSTHEFIVSLRRNYVSTADPQEDGRNDPNAFNWSLLNTRIAPYVKGVNGANCMLGPMDVQVKVRKVTQRQARRPTGEVVRPEEMESVQEKEKQETDRNLEEMWDVLRISSPCTVAELVCNHHCFAQTVENLFTLSFLVRDQRASLSHDPRQGMMVEFVDNERRQAGRGSVHPLQFIMSFTMQEWDVMKKLVKPNETKMKHRDQSALMALNVVAAQRQQEGGQEAGPSSGRRASLPQTKKRKADRR